MSNSISLPEMRVIRIDGIYRLFGIFLPERERSVMKEGNIEKIDQTIFEILLQSLNGSVWQIN
ncbi:hypothetical protein [Nitrosomonas cryotolerans]|nr:hypothetical protein [Nitrosomonas cryotolerans]